jgi:hypothetical protein
MDWKWGAESAALQGYLRLVRGRATVYKLNLKSCGHHVDQCPADGGGTERGDYERTAIVGTLTWLPRLVSRPVGTFTRSGSNGGGVHPTTAITRKVVDIMNSDTCKQLDSASGGLLLTAPRPGDSATGSGAPGGGSAPPVVTFPQTSNGHRYAVCGVTGTRSSLYRWRQLRSGQWSSERRVFV